jgi:hypothetical protein
MRAGGEAVIKQRWVRVLVVALVIFLINAIARLISRFAVDDAAADGVNPIAVSGAAAYVLFMAGCGAYWAVRHPFPRLFFDLGAAAVSGTLLCLLIGPFIGGGTPFDEGLDTFVGEFLQFLGLAAIGVFLGFVAMIVLGKDWKSRGLRRYEENYKKRPHRTVRG